MDMGNGQPVAASSMYFSPWSVFETHLLFIGWVIRQPWQFALSWFAVAFAAIVYVQLDCMTRCFEKAMLKFLSNPNVKGTPHLFLHSPQAYPVLAVSGYSSYPVG
jgi:Ctr copper transporter family